MSSLRQEASSERSARDKAEARLGILEKKVDAAHEGAEKIVLEMKLECQSRVEALKEKVSAEEERFRAEITRSIFQTSDTSDQELDRPVGHKSV